MIKKINYHLEKMHFMALKKQLKAKGNMERLYKKSRLKPAFFREEYS